MIGGSVYTMFNKEKQGRKGYKQYSYQMEIPELV